MHVPSCHVQLCWGKKTRKLLEANPRFQGIFRRIPAAWADLGRLSHQSSHYPTVCVGVISLQWCHGLGAKRFPQWSIKSWDHEFVGNSMKKLLGHSLKTNLKSLDCSSSILNANMPTSANIYSTNITGADWSLIPSPQTWSLIGDPKIAKLRLGATRSTQEANMSTWRVSFHGSSASRVLIQKVPMEDIVGDSSGNIQLWMW